MTTRQIVIDIPETVFLSDDGIDEVTFAQELKVLAAVRLYKQSGRAAELADMSRVEFLLNLKNHRIFSLKSELLDLEKNLA